MSLSLSLYIYILESSGRASRGLDSFWPCMLSSELSLANLGNSSGHDCNPGMHELAATSSKSRHV